MLTADDLEDDIKEYCNKNIDRLIESDKLLIWFLTKAMDSMRGLELPDSFTHVGEFLMDNSRTKCYTYLINDLVEIKHGYRLPKHRIVEVENLMASLIESPIPIYENMKLYDALSSKFSIID